MTRPNDRFANQVLLITGSTGIAAESARIAAAQGGRIFIAGLDQDSCRELATETGGAYRAEDLSVTSNAEQAVSACLESFGRIDGVFNAAGISGRRYGDGPLHEMTDEGWDRTMAVNVRSVFLVSRAVLKHWMGQTPPFPGAIVNMSSVIALSPEPRHFSTHGYAAGKAAILGLTRSAAAYYAPHGIRINAIAPGLVRTPMSARAQGSPEILDFIQRKQPLTRGILEPREVANAALFLLSREALGITGEVLGIDGGWQTSGACMYRERS